MPVNGLARIAGAGLLLFTVSGCAIGWTDPAGARHLLGFVDVSIRPSDNDRLAGDIVEVSTFGVSLLSGSHATSLTLGYNRTTTAAFRDNALARGPFDRVIVHEAAETRTPRGK